MIAVLAWPLSSAAQPLTGGVAQDVFSSGGSGGSSGNTTYPTGSQSHQPNDAPCANPFGCGRGNTGLAGALGALGSALGGIVNGVNGVLKGAASLNANPPVRDVYCQQSPGQPMYGPYHGTGTQTPCGSNFQPAAPQPSVVPTPLPWEQPAWAAPQKPPCRAPSPTHLRLYNEPWLTNPILKNALIKAKASFQSNKLARGKQMAFDEYSITITQMPANLTPERLLRLLATDTNATVDGYGPNGTRFDQLTTFVRRQKGPPVVGELIDIQIPGDPGTVQLVELKPDHFIFQTVTTPEMGTHPVDGARQFGFRRVGSNIVFYTQGAERPYNEALRMPGKLAQDTTWTSFMKAIGEMVNKLGGVADLETVRPDRVDIDCD